MRKKNLLYKIGLLAITFFTISCSDYLDRDDNDQITEAEVFSRYEKVNELVTDV